MRFHSIAVFAIVLVPFVSKSQTNDFGIWTSIGAEKKFRDWDFETSGNLRSKDNSEQIDRLSLKVEGGYNILKPVKVGLSYEYMYFNDIKYSDFQNRHRFSGYLQGKQKLGRFSFYLTERMQVTTKDESDRIKSSGNIDSYRANPAWTWRNKFKVSYNIRKSPITPAFAVESYFLLNDPEGSDFYKIRYTMEISYKLSRNHNLKVFGLFDHEINVTNSVNSYISGIEYNYSF
ncbi:MAG: DUF2490 domain-containing protein [Bacteroidales bacterium]